MSNMFQLNTDDQRSAILADKGHVLVMGGPGSGKTTIALFKAKSILNSDILKPGQKVLFLSFARATVSRIEENAGTIFTNEEKKSIEINTYHGFIWNILKNHGYLLNTQPIKLWTPHEASIRLSSVSPEKLHEEKCEIFRKEGLVHFDIFAQLCNELLTASQSLRKIYSSIYPVIILDEFQDTNSDEWKLIETMGIESTLIALADPEQRIYDFRGADPKRITHFLNKYSPSIYDFGKENNRSNGTDIAQFGNDLLTGDNKGKEYKNVFVLKYKFCQKPLTHLYLKYCVLGVIKQLEQAHSDDGWSLAILVPTNALMMEVSDVFQSVQTLKNGQKLPTILHEVAFDPTGPSLAAVFVSTLLESISDINTIINALINHILGRRGNKSASQKDIEFSEALKKYIKTGKIVGKRRKELVDDCQDLLRETNKLVFTGNIITDWKRIIELISNCKSSYLQQIAKDLKYLRLLQKGSLLHSSLDELWRNNNNYVGAVNAVENALTQEHFSMSSKTWQGVNVMTIHKAKGKEFDEVIIYEGWYQNRIVNNPENIDQSRLNLRVAVTRARDRTFIITPEGNTCPLL